MIRIADTPSRHLDTICKEHYSGLKSLVSSAITKGIKGKRKDYLLSHLETIITGKPNELLKTLRNYRTFCIRNRTQPYKSGLIQAFSYSNFSKRKSYNIYHLAKKLDFNVCPYCNRQFTFTVIDKKKETIRPEFDHFFSQKEFPLFSLSFYNLIPSCHICNSNLKGDKTFNLINFIHPYLSEFSKDCSFNYIPLEVKASEGLSDNFKVELTIKNSSSIAKNIKGNLDAFKLDKIYLKHNDVIREIVRKKYISGGHYLTRLKKMFDPHLKDIDELYQIAFGNYYKEDEHEKRPLAKFSRDIFNNTQFI